MAEYEDLEGFSVVFMMMHGSDDIIAMGMHIASTDYEYSDPSLGHGMIERTIGRADARLEDMYGTALLTGNVYSDIGKKEELGAKLLIDAAERGCLESFFPAALCLIGGIGVERDAARVNQLRDIALRSIESYEDASKRQSTLSTIETHIRNLVVAAVSFENDPETTKEVIIDTINMLGSELHDLLLKAKGSDRFFRQEISDQFGINEFGKA